MRFLIILSFLAVAASANAQTGPVISAGPTPLQGGVLGCYTAPAVNATQAAGTCSIAVGANQHAYFNFLQVGACVDFTANAVSAPQLAFTSTNLGGWTQQIDAPFQGGGTLTATTLLQGCQYVGGARSHPLVSVAGPVTVTIVPPAQQAHSSYPIIAQYYLAQ